MSEIQKIPLFQIASDPNQPRKYYDEAALQELAASIKEDGVIQPIIVRPDADGFMIVCGERRYRASLLADMEDIPAIVKPMSNEQALQLQIVENLLRKDVHPIEEAVAFKSLALKFSAEEIATRVGKSLSYVVKRIKLADLIPDAQDIYFRNLIEMKHAQMLCRLTPEEQQDVIDEACKRDKKTKKITDVNPWRIERSCENNMVTLDKAPFKTNDAKLYPEAGACTKCPHNSANSPLLFDDMKGRICTKQSCFNIKVMRADQARLQEIGADPNRIVVVDSGYLNDRDKGKIEAAKELGITILDRKLWEREYGAPDDEFESWEEYLENCFWDDEEPTEKELAQAKKDYAEDKARWEKERAEYQRAVAAGEIKEAYSLLDGRTIPIRLKGPGKAIADVQSGNAGDAAILAEIAGIEQREARAKELDGEKVWKQILELLKVDELTKEMFSTAPLSEAEMTAAFHAMADKIPYANKNWIKEHFGDIDEDVWDGVTEFGFQQMVRIFIAATLPNAYGSHLEKGSKNYYAYKMLNEHAGTRISIIEQEQQEKADKRQANVAKRIAALQAKLETTTEPA